MSVFAWIALGSFLLSVVTFVATQFGGKRTATASYVSQLETRVKDLEGKVSALSAENDRLFNENVALMKKLVGS